MRATDLVPPAITPHVLPPDAPMARWPGRLVIGLERLPQAAYVWDDADAAVVYDAAGDPYVWDAPFVGSGYTDASCDFHAMTLESGEPDELGVFPPGEMVLTLANPHGEYTQRTTDGRLVYYAPGRGVAVGWVDDAAVWWWLWAGKITDWRENPDATVTVDAFSGLAELAQDPGAPWTPGTPGQYPGQRLEAILTAFGYIGARRLALGDAPLLAPVTSRQPLEECQTVALSDGGIVNTDADGAVVYVGRGWRAGRADQLTVPAFSDNVCSVDAVVWDLELANADDGLATDVVLTNAATTPVTVRASLPQTDPDAWWYHGPRYRLTHPDPDLWQVTADGQALANFLLGVRSIPTVAIAAFTLYVHDPRQDLWSLATDRRVGDRVRFVRDQVDPGGAIATLDVELVVSSIRHEITPDSWVATLSTTRAVSYLAPEEWDVTALVWDLVDPRNTWRF